ncbi:MAG: hypothetical protein IPK58_25990 [Acidobacteria bacterium]|nr:hypothetical protein [Acidobacteriota bacterium]
MRRLIRARTKGKFASFADLVKSGCLDSDKFSSEQAVIAGYVFVRRSKNRRNEAGVLCGQRRSAGRRRDQTGDRHFWLDSTLGVKVTDENRPAKSR